MFVVNEWLWSDVAGQNHEVRRAQATAFIEEFPKRDHRLVLVKGSKFDHKAWRACSSHDERTARAGKLFAVNIRIDLDRCIPIEEVDLPRLDEALAAQVNPDDHYLLRAQLAFPEAFIATTDQRLIDTLRAHQTPVLTREDFLATHFGIAC
jgi:hypothetical protein